LKDTTERYVIVSGTGLVEIGDNRPREVSQGHTASIPPMDRQRITNIGEEDLIFMAICTPRFITENYESA